MNHHASVSHVDPRDMRNAFGCFPTGVAIVTASGSDGRLIGLTVNSLVSVSLHPPALSWCIRNESPNFSNFATAAHFGVSVLAHDQEWICRRFATAIEDKFSGVDMEVGEFGVPLVRDSVAMFECERRELVVCGDHAIVIGFVKHYVWLKQKPPLLFFKGAIYADSVLGTTA